MDPAKRGLAAAIVNTSYQLGSALGLATMTAVAAALGGDQIDRTRPPERVEAGPDSTIAGLAPLDVSQALF